MFIFSQNNITQNGVYIRVYSAETVAPTFSPRSAPSRRCSGRVHKNMNFYYHKHKAKCCTNCSYTIHTQSTIKARPSSQPIRSLTPSHPHAFTPILSSSSFHSPFSSLDLTQFSSRMHPVCLIKRTESHRTLVCATGRRSRKRQSRGTRYDYPWNNHTSKPKPTTKKQTIYRSSDCGWNMGDEENIVTVFVGLQYEPRSTFLACTTYKYIYIYLYMYILNIKRVHTK